MSERAQLAAWRDAVRDSDLDLTSKAVAFTIGTYFRANGSGAYPSKTTIAAGAGLRSVRAVVYAVRRLERAGFLQVNRSRGRRANTYTATLPTVHGDARLDGFNGASDDSERCISRHRTVHGDAPESDRAKAKISNASRASARGEKRRAPKTARFPDLSAYDE